MPDVIVLGLGAMGSAAAHQLASRGRSVVGIDRYAPPHPFGSSHGTSRVIRQAYFESSVYVPLAIRAYELWSALEQDAATRLMTITGALMIGSPDSAVFTGSAASARAWNLPHEILDAPALRRRYPALSPGDGLMGLHELRGGFVHPERCVLAQLERAAAAGATLQFNELVQSWTAVAGGIRVTTSRGTYEAGQLVIAAGPWAPELLGGIALPLTIERQVIYFFSPLSGNGHFEKGRLPVWVWELEPGRELYGFPADESGDVKVAFYRPGTPCTPQTIDRTVHAAEVETIRAALRGRVPGLGDLASASTCMYTTTPDFDFVLGAHPHHENVIIASPCSGHGFKFASAVGEIVADLLTDGRSKLPIDAFSPSRFVV